MGMFDQPMEPISPYDLLRNQNFILRFSPMFNSGFFKFSSDTDKVVMPQRFTYLKLPWLLSNMKPGRRCGLWLEMMSLKCLGFIPKECRKCWKVVARPQTLEQLFKVYNYQQQSGYECKCGIEVRSYVRGNYGAYFYTDSYEECGERYIKVRAELDKIGPDIPVIMKRSCTEYERDFGPSNEYKHPPDADYWEEQLYKYLDWPVSKEKLPTPMIIEVKQKWIDFAWERDDFTVDMFTNSKPLHPPVYTYHDQYMKEVKDA